jgi:hypothetical protein
VVVVAIVTQYVWDTGLPFWGVFITLALAAIYVIPVGIVYAVANLNSNNLTGLGELISGYLLPGKPLILLIFKVCRSPTLVEVKNSSLYLVLRVHWYQSGHDIQRRYEGQYIFDSLL